MGNANWCKVGDHPYPEDQPGATTLTLDHQVKNQWGGYQPSNLVRTICAACADDIGVRLVGQPSDDMSEADLLEHARRQRANAGGKSMLSLAAPKRDLPVSNRKDGKFLVDPEVYAGYMDYLQNPEENSG